MMTWKDYEDQVTADAIDYIDEEAANCSDWEEMREWLFVADQVTGNGSGSYTFSAAKAAENVAGIVFDPDVMELFRWSGYEHIPIEDGPEAVDVIARCIALGEVEGRLEDAYQDAVIGLRWACPVCSDKYNADYVEMRHGEGGDLVCPLCGSETVAPIDDGCPRMDEHQHAAQWGLIDTHEDPNEIPETRGFALWDDLQDYAADTPGLWGRLRDGYAEIVEL